MLKWPSGGKLVVALSVSVTSTALVLICRSELEPTDLAISTLLGVFGVVLSFKSGKGAFPRLSKTILNLARACIFISLLLMSVSEERDLGTTLETAKRIREIVSANKDFAAGHGGFAHNLRELGFYRSPFRYSISYRASEENGVVRHYVLTATPRDKNGIYFYADESGQLTHEFREPANNSSSPWPMNRSGTTAGNQ